MADEGDRQRRRRQQRELVHGSGVPRSVMRALSPATRPRRGRRWNDMGRAEKYALVQSQLIMWALVLAVAFFLVTKVSAVLGAAYLAVMLSLFAWILYRIVRNEREP